jgi:hypothetical protein
MLRLLLAVYTLDHEGRDTSRKRGTTAKQSRL